MYTKHRYTNTLLLFLMTIFTACSPTMRQPPITATPSPTNTMTPQPTNTSLPTTTLTKTATSTPASKFPAGPLRELEKSLGTEYALITSEEGSFYTTRDNNGNIIPDVKFFEDGTAELTYEHRAIKYTLTIAFQAIITKDDGIEFGLWKYSNGEYNLETHPAPKDATETQSWRKLVILRGHEKEQALIDTVFAAREMSFTIDDYNPMSEFEGITFTSNFKTFENFDVRPRKWKVNNWSREWMHGKLDGTGVETTYRFRAVSTSNEIVVDDGGSQAIARPMQVALGTGWFNIEIYLDDGTLDSPVVHVPIIAMNPDRSLMYMSALVREDNLLRDNVINRLTKEDRHKLWMWLFKRPISYPGWILSDPKLMALTTGVNQEFFEKVRMPKLGNGVTTGDESWFLSSLPKELSHTFMTILAPR